MQHSWIYVSLEPDPISLIQPPSLPLFQAIPDALVTHPICKIADTHEFSCLQIAQRIVHESPCTLSQRPVYVVAGSKNLGKSTLARLLVNTLLNSHAEVGFLDCDLGQAEFTTPGEVTILPMSVSLLKRFCIRFLL